MIHEIVKNDQMIFRKDPCIHTRTWGKNVHVLVLSRRNAQAHVFALCACVCAQIFTKNLWMILYYLMTRNIKFHKDWRFCCRDIRKTILMFVQSLFFYVFSIFSTFQPQRSINIENHKLVIWNFGNLISKWSVFSEKKRPSSPHLRQ